MWPAPWISSAVGACARVNFPGDLQQESLFVRVEGSISIVELIAGSELRALDCSSGGQLFSRFTHGQHLTCPTGRLTESEVRRHSLYLLHPRGRESRIPVDGVYKGEINRPHHPISRNVCRFSHLVDLPCFPTHHSRSISVLTTPRRG